MKPSTQQFKVIHTLLPDSIKSDKQAKQDFVTQYTGSEALTSMRDLTYDQANEMIVSLGGEPIEEDFTHYARFDHKLQQHRYLLSLCYQKGWVRFDNKLNKNVADLKHLGAWLAKYGYLKKPLMQYNLFELPKLVTQFENVLR